MWWRHVTEAGVRVTWLEAEACWRRQPPSEASKRLDPVTLSFQSSGLQSWKRISLVLSHPVCATHLIQQPWKTNPTPRRNGGKGNQSLAAGTVLFSSLHLSPSSVALCEGPHVGRLVREVRSTGLLQCWVRLTRGLATPTPQKPFAQRKWDH